MLEFARERKRGLKMVWVLTLILFGKFYHSVNSDSDKWGRQAGGKVPKLKNRAAHLPTLPGYLAD